jgi:hypothetical protein
MKSASRPRASCWTRRIPITEIAVSLGLCGDKRVQPRVPTLVGNNAGREAAEIPRGAAARSAPTLPCTLVENELGESPEYCCGPENLIHGDDLTRCGNATLWPGALQILRRAAIVCLPSNHSTTTILSCWSKSHSQADSRWHLSARCPRLSSIPVHTNEPSARRIDIKASPPKQRRGDHRPVYGRSRRGPLQSSHQEFLHPAACAREIS